MGEIVVLVVARTNRNSLRERLIYSLQRKYKHNLHITKTNTIINQRTIASLNELAMIGDQEASHLSPTILKDHS